MASSVDTSLPSVVRALEQRVELLIESHRKLSLLNSRLSQQINQARASEREAFEKVRSLERELAAAIVGGATTKGRAKAKAQINRLMREVENCITLLSSAEGAKREGHEREEHEVEKQEVEEQERVWQEREGQEAEVKAEE